MENVQFENESAYSPLINRPEKKSFLSKMAMKLGAKNEEQAQKVLMGIAIAAFILTLIVIYNQFGGQGGEVETDIENIPPAAEGL